MKDYERSNSSKDENYGSKLLAQRDNIADLLFRSGNSVEEQLSLRAQYNELDDIIKEFSRYTPNVKIDYFGFDEIQEHLYDGGLFLDFSYDYQKNRIYDMFFAILFFCISFLVW